MKIRYFKNNSKYLKWFNKNRDNIKINNIKINNHKVIVKYMLRDKYGKNSLLFIR